MRRQLAIALALVAGVGLAAGCKRELDRDKPGAAGSSAPATHDVTASAAATAFVQAEAAFQATVAEGTPDAFVAAAAALHARGTELQQQLENVPPGELFGQVAYITGMLSTVDVKLAANRHVRQVLAQTVHERLTKLALAPLPYPADPALTKDNADLVSASERPHGGVDEALRSDRALVDQMCACKDNACAQSSYHAFRLWAATYADLKATDEQAAQMSALGDRLIACYKQATGRP